MPESLIAVNLFVCERALQENDGVLSVIRVVDLFRFTLTPDLPSDKQAIRMTVAVMMKFRSNEAGRTHSLQLRLIRPDGDTTDLGEPLERALESNVPDVPLGFNVLAPLGLIPKQIGVHYVACLVDGDEVARTPITLLPQQAEKAD